ncbi:MAG: Phenylalanine-tRNA ligase alpha subunit [Microgenomates group bacterium GW2011_GWC1_41_8]|uniref:Phenylalanine--tRNA ligase alpha subunit n=2 Tax=Candidatus Roizmaniibacteriota TaxID=1752723 RepID=A0A0G0T9C5_9BACT|nr:MAG: Phenylalanine-tRNA ligase alpha subunit [Candidatus Roizmanbacteria bacterium GW2011_GWB1_40_7]KKR92181.1 MAG: Phenylalanine-tRNA ligase alpha subunit [Candidatus Roizmanbacteria bacterium GW2011_GWA1_41_13]KKS23837.1 MAG: Phenylalanine-tRNA ligase alpha subunit [Microgenomates group bacterium GW2011_GWC1_41_8]
MENKIQFIRNTAIRDIYHSPSLEHLEVLRVSYLGRKGGINELLSQINKIDIDKRREIGVQINQLKTEIEEALVNRGKELKGEEFKKQKKEFFDVTAPAIKPSLGHLHLITQAIEDISEIFKRIGFNLVSYPEVEYDWYVFESLNMPKEHAARDEWETFFVDMPADNKLGEVVLTPHTSNGQVREMERLGKPPVRMINIGKCYRRQSDISHSSMFHQFEGLAVDKGLGIGDLKGVMEFFVHEYFGPERQMRLRPFHFQFTEPSFEIDITCDVCKGKGCRLCKEGWLELGGSGMTHPNVLKNGGIDPKKYSAFAFGWGVERVLMMREGINIPDLRMLYSNDVRFLEQF